MLRDEIRAGAWNSARVWPRPPSASASDTRGMHLAGPAQGEWKSRGTDLLLQPVYRYRYKLLFFYPTSIWGSSVCSVITVLADHCFGCLGKRGVAACCVTISPHSRFVGRQAPLFSGDQMCAACWQETQHIVSGLYQERLRNSAGRETRIPFSIEAVYFSHSKSRVANVLACLCPLFHQTTPEQKRLDDYTSDEAFPVLLSPCPAAASRFYSLQLYPKWEWDRKPHTLLESRRQGEAIPWEPPGKTPWWVKDGSRSSSFHSVHYH